MSKILFWTDPAPDLAASTNRLRDVYQRIVNDRQMQAGTLYGVIAG